jgi:cell division protein FtsI/penicillin-binding protein 2
MLALIIVARLFYWQVVRADFLTSRASSQHEQVVNLDAQRGDILASDGSLMAGTAENFLLYVYKPQLEKSATEISRALAPIIGPVSEATSGMELAISPDASIRETEEFLLGRLNQDHSWVALKHYLNRDQKEAIQNLQIKGLGFESQMVRFYPEGSMSGQLMGFVGQDINGSPRGYFGLEGFYDRQLQGQAGKYTEETDAWGNPILVGNYSGFDSRNGRDLLSTLNRGVQYQVEKILKQGLEKYQAQAGSVVVLDPKTGAVLAMASFPNYNPKDFFDFPTEYYKNPAVANLFEPGSIFKPIVMAAALDAQVVKPDTSCNICDSPIHIGTFTIGTWNNEYHPQTSMTDTIIHSDNTGMVFAARHLGVEKFAKYLDNFGIGHKTGIDLEEETTGVLRPAKDWKEIDLATISFGQGIALTPIQITAAVNALANQGVWVQPYLIRGVKDQGRTVDSKPNNQHQVISQEAARQIKQMMIEAIEQGEAKWAKPKNMSVAGKTGTAQIPVAGHYDAEKTIASFIGWSPADNPKFTMLVSLREPQTSQWGSETAAPLWFDIAKQISLLL